MEAIFALHANQRRESTGKGRQHSIRGTERFKRDRRLEDARGTTSVKLRSASRKRSGTLHSSPSDFQSSCLLTLDAL